MSVKQKTSQKLVPASNVVEKKNLKRKLVDKKNVENVESKQKVVVMKEAKPKGKKDRPKKVKRIEKEESNDDKQAVKKIKTENGAKENKTKSPKAFVKDKKSKLVEKIKVKKDSAKFGDSAKTEDGVEKKPLTKVESREKQKKLKEERRKKKDGRSVFELSVQAKKVWEEVRREDCPKEKQGSLLKELHELVKGKVATIVHAHDTSRVIECLVSLGDEKIRDSLYEELKDDLIGLMKSRYASFFVMKLVRHGNKEQKAKVFKVLEGQVARLARHKVANAVLELCYNDFSNGVQRNHFIQEFFGSEFQHFKDDAAKNVLDVLKAHPEKLKSVMINLQENSNILITKGCYNISLVHSVLYNYMLALNFNSGVQNEKNKSEFVGSLREVCVHLIHSHDGARLTMQALWLGNAKDRKSIIKSFKGHVPKIAAEEQGHLALLALFDSVDDTKLVGKAIVGELVPNMKEILATKHGRDVIVYLMAPRNTVWFYPGTLDILKQGDGNVNSKKDAEIRRKELFEIAAPPILKYLAENLIDIIKEGGTSIIMLQEVLKTSSKSTGEDINNLFQSVLSLLADEAAKPFVSGEEVNNIVENAATHRLFNKLMTQDKENKSVAGSVLFSTLLVNALDSDSIESYLGCNRGCFLLVNLLETGIEEVQKKLVVLLEPMQNRMRRKNMKGAEILKKKLDELLPKKF